MTVPSSLISSLPCRGVFAVCAAWVASFALLACSSDPEPVDEKRETAPLQASPEQLEYAEMSHNPRPQDVPRLLDGLESEDDLVRTYAVRGLSVLAPPEALVPLYTVSVSDVNPRVVREAEQALRSYRREKVEQVALQHDPVQRRRVEARDQRRQERVARQQRQLARLEPPVPRDVMEEWAAEDHPDVGFFVTDVNLVRDHAPVGHPLGYNGEANAGQLLEFEVSITNASSMPRMSSSAYAYTYDEYTTVINRELPVPTMEPNEEAALQRTLLVHVSPDAPERHSLELFLEVGDSRLNALTDGRPVYRPIRDIEVSNVGFGPVQFELEDLVDDVWGHSDGNGNGIAEWGETVEVRLSARNLGSYALRESRMRLRSESRLADVYTPSDAQRKGEVPPGGRPGFARTFAVSLAHGYEGNFAVPLTVELLVPHYSETVRPDTSRVFLSDYEERRRPTGVFRFRQELELRVGTDQVVPVSEVETYEPVDLDRLIQLFVLDNDTRAQHRFLERTEQRFLDARDTLLAE